MRLNEWQYINKPAASTSNTSSGTNNKSFKKRLDKLIQYHSQHLPAEVDYITINLLTKDTLDFTEHYHDYSSVRYNIFIELATEAWKLWRLKKDKKATGNVPCEDSFTGTGWVNLLKKLQAYIKVPTTGTQEYNDLLTEALTEWKLMNPPKSTSSKTNKEKFKELTDYMQKHKDSSTIFTSVNGPNDTGFEYEEQRVFADGREYNLSVEVSLGKHNLFTIHIDKDGKRIDNIMANGWEDFLRYLKIYFNAPALGSPEHKSICESASFADDFRLYENLWN